jgi:LysM repeat protein/predicted transposase YbfD/YdcC
MLLSLALHANEQFMSINEYINQYKNIAIAEMERTGIPASIKIGQAILESNHGNSKLSRNSNNHFGIKCKKEWRGKKYFHKDDDRDRRGRLIKSCFRVYDNVIDSYIDHSNFLLTRDRYAGLFKLSRTDYKAWAYELKKSGYATAKHYATKLISIIEKNELYILDFQASNPAIAKSYSTSTQLYQYQLQQSKNAKLTIKNLSFLPTKPLKPLINTNQSDIPDLGERLYGVSYFPKRHNINGVFLNNGLRALALPDGYSLKDISKYHKVDVSKLLKYNDLSPNQLLLRGQYIYLMPKETEYKSKTFHEVKAGETLYIVSQLYGVDYEALRIRNRLNNGNLKPGMKIKLNGKKVKPKSYSVKKVAN